MTNTLVLFADVLRASLSPAAADTDTPPPDPLPPCPSTGPIRPALN